MQVFTDKITAEKVPGLPPTHFIDNRIYTDEGIFREERAHIFSKVWNFVIHESEIPNPGSFKTVNVAGYPLLLVRQSDGTIKGFYNICRHRQAPLVRSCFGEAKAFQCFYHLWTYGLDGKLLGVTLPEGYQNTGFQKEDFGLIEVRVSEAAGMVFVCLSDDTEPLEQFLGEVAPALTRHIPPVGLEIFHFHQAELKTNWKLFQENNNEPYHTALHWSNRSAKKWGEPEFTGRKMFLPNGHNCYTPEGNRYMIDGGYQEIGLEERGDHLFPGIEKNTQLSVHLFPDVLFIIRSTALRIDRLIPISPGLTVLESRGLGFKGDSSEVRSLRVKHHNEIWGYSGSNLPEDIIATESQWPTMASGAVRYSIIAREGDVMSDETMRHYYMEWSRRLGRAYWDPFGEMKGEAKP